MSDNRTPEQIEEELRRARQDMQDTVDQLAAQLDPKVKVQEFKDTSKVKSQEFKESAKVKGQEAKVKAQSLFEAAQAGDTKAIGTIAGAAGALITALGIAYFAKRN